MKETRYDMSKHPPKATVVDSPDPRLDKPTMEWLVSLGVKAITVDEAKAPAEAVDGLTMTKKKVVSDAL